MEGTLRCALAAWATAPSLLVSLRAGNLHCQGQTWIPTSMGTAGLAQEFLALTHLGFHERTITTHVSLLPKSRSCGQVRNIYILKETAWFIVRCERIVNH